MFLLYIYVPSFMFIVTLLWLRIRNFLYGGVEASPGVFKSYYLRSSFRVKRGAGLDQEWFERSDPALK
jgi:hypothetical protein